MAFEMGGIFIVPNHLLCHGTSVFKVSFEGPPQFNCVQKGNGFTTSKKCCGEWKDHVIFNPGPWGPFNGGLRDSPN